MKKIIVICLFSLPLITIGQTLDRTKAPAPAKAPVIQVASPFQFTLANGLKVFVVKNTKLPRVTATLALDIDGFAEGPIAGVADMSGQLMKRGTVKLCWMKQLNFLEVVYLLQAKPLLRVL
jgi:hypothetical protein